MTYSFREGVCIDVFFKGILLGKGYIVTYSVREEVLVTYSYREGICSDVFC